MNSFEVEFAQLKEEERVLAGRNKNEAFTLIELLVVIAIIAILAAILFPVFAQAKEAAKQTADISNVKQIVLADIMYATDYDDSLPLQSEAGEEYIIAMNLQPYVKNEQIFTSPKVTVSGGTTQQRWTDLLPDPTYQTDPALLGVTSTGSDLDMWPDVYPACDYQVNSNFATMGTEVDDFHSVNIGTLDRPADVARWLNFPGVAEDFDTSGPARDLSYLSGGMATAYNETLGASKEGKRTVGHMDGHAKVHQASTLWPVNPLPDTPGNGAPGNGAYPNWGVSPQFSDRVGVSFGAKG